MALRGEGYNTPRKSILPEGDIQVKGYANSALLHN